jgi:hypothetical protein
MTLRLLDVCVWIRAIIDANIRGTFPCSNSNSLVMSSEPTTSCFPDILPTRDLGASSESSNVQSLLEEAVKKYEEKVGTSLIEEQVAIQLKTCDDVESIAKLLEERVQAFRESRGRDYHPKMKKSIKRVVHVLHTIFSGPRNILGGGVVQLGRGIASAVRLNPPIVSVFLVPNSPILVIPTCNVTILCDWHPPRCRHLPRLLRPCYPDI